MSLLDWGQLAVVAAPVNTLRIRGALEILLKHILLSHRTVPLLSYLVHAISEAVGDAAHDGAPNLVSRRRPELH